jgi:hypothetical protein
MEARSAAAARRIDATGAEDSIVATHRSSAKRFSSLGDLSCAICPCFVKGAPHRVGQVLYFYHTKRRIFGKLLIKKHEINAAEAVKMHYVYNECPFKPP